MLLKFNGQTLRQLFMFIISGFLSFIADYASLVAFVEVFRMHYMIASMLSFLLSCCVNYMFSIRFVFNCKAGYNSAGRFSVFFVLSLIGLAFTEILMLVFVKCLDIQYYISKIFVTGIVMVWNFVSKKFFLE